jgi:elongation factor G
VTDVKATVHFGKFHEVDSDEHSFKLAGAHAFHAACLAAKPLILEPLIDVEIDVPSRFLGDVSGDLNSRRGRILGVESSGDHTKLRARVPMAEMTTYATELRSLTAGRVQAEVSA